jgi:hypothetical protein
VAEKNIEPAAQEESNTSKFLRYKVEKQYHFGVTFAYYRKQAFFVKVLKLFKVS